jgi:hypothetical protein
MDDEPTGDALPTKMLSHVLQSAQEHGLEDIEVQARLASRMLVLARFCPEAVDLPISHVSEVISACDETWGWSKTHSVWIFSLLETLARMEALRSEVHLPKDWPSVICAGGSLDGQPPVGDNAPQKAPWLNVLSYALLHARPTAPDDLVRHARLQVRILDVFLVSGRGWFPVFGPLEVLADHPDTHVDVRARASALQQKLTPFVPK